MPRLYPPSHPLGSAWLKVQRAHVHINALNRSVNHTLPTKAVPWEEREAEGPGKFYEATVDPSMPHTWGTIIGDIVGNLRQSLDHIAWALAARQWQHRHIYLSSEQARDIIFPLYEEPAVYTACKALPLIWAPAIPDIEQLQPYHRTQRPELELLAILQELSNSDKHRVVTPTTMSVPMIPRERPEAGFIANLSNDDQPVKFMVTERTVAKAGGNFKPRITPSIGIHSQIRFGQTVGLWELPLIHDFIRDEVIPLFARHFP